MNALNYQKKMDSLILKLKGDDRTKRVLIHSCCAPCSSYVMEYMSQFFEVTMFFYNPNINTREEYERRLSELTRLISQMKLDLSVSLIAEEYDPLSFEQVAVGHEGDPEGGSRCRLCYRLRLEKAAQYVQKYNLSFPQRKYEFIATTLTISPHKDARVINEIGVEISQNYNLNYLESDFKKKDGFKRSLELSKMFGLYRQNYCGCRFSKKLMNVRPGR